MRERVEDRHERILRIVREHGSIRIEELARAVGTSLETLRRDAIALADVGKLRRVHGKVYWPTVPMNARDARVGRGGRVRPRDPVLGMVVPVAGYYYESVVQGARAICGAAGARLLIGFTGYAEERDAAQLETMLEAGADGLILTPSWTRPEEGAELMDRTASRRIPVVLLERAVAAGTAGARLDRVCTDHAEGAAMAVHHLVGLGHRRVALLARTSQTGPRLRQGYLAATAALGLPDDDLGRVRAREPERTLEDFERDVARLLPLVDAGEVRAAVVNSDGDAVNLLRRLRSHGLSVPEDFAIVSYDDELAALADVPLSAVSPPKRALGEHAAALLLRRLADPDGPREHLDLLPTLTVRDSCGAKRTAPA